MYPARNIYLTTLATLKYSDINCVRFFSLCARIMTSCHEQLSRDVAFDYGATISYAALLYTSCDLNNAYSRANSSWCSRRMNAYSKSVSFCWVELSIYTELEKLKCRLPSGRAYSSQLTKMRVRMECQVVFGWNQHRRRFRHTSTKHLPGYNNDKRIFRVVDMSIATLSCVAGVQLESVATSYGHVWVETQKR